MSVDRSRINYYGNDQRCVCASESKFLINNNRLYNYGYMRLTLTTYTFDHVVNSEHCTALHCTGYVIFKLQSLAMSGTGDKLC